MMIMDRVIANQTVLVLVMAMLKQMNAIDARLITLQQPENFNTPYRTNGDVKNNAEAKRFLCAIVAYTTKFPGMVLKAIW